MLRVLFALEGLAWLALLVLDLATTSAQMETARRIPMVGMPVWIALTAALCLAMTVAAALAVRAGRGMISTRLPSPLGGVTLVFGMVFRSVMWIGTMAWVTTMNGLQSV